MTSQLFAFRIARPSEEVSEVTQVTYDPQAQLAVWKGSPRAMAALHCTGGKTYNQGRDCNAYGEYCNVWNYGYPFPGYWCDL